jgi:hypothetical protein
MRALLAAMTAALVALSGCSSCADLSVARPFPCDPMSDDAAQCPEGWKCGREKTCFDASADAGQAWRCADSARDCSDGWRCGAADSQEERRCQRIGVGGPYPCQGNDDCEADWRCDPVGHACTEAADQLARSKLSSLLVDQASPRLPVGEPKFAAVGQLQSAIDIGFGQPSRGRVVGLVADGGLHVLTIVENGSRAPGGRARVELVRYGVDERALVQLSTLGARVVGVLADGRVLAWDRDTEAVEVIDGGARRVVSLAPGQVPGFELAVVRDTDVVVFRPTGEAKQLEGDGGRVVDVCGNASLALVLHERTVDSHYLLSTNPPTTVSLDVSVPPLARIGLGNRLLVEVAADAGVAPNRRWGLAAYDGSYTLTAGPCEVCPFGALPEQVQYLPTSNEELYARCPSEADAGLPVARTWRVRMDRSGDCAFTRFTAVDEDEAPFQFGVVPGHSDYFWRAHAGAGGRAWYAEDLPDAPKPRPDDDLATLHPILLDRQPDFLGRVQLGTEPTVVALAGVHTYTQSVAGLVSELTPSDPNALTVVGAVAGSTQLLITQHGVYNLAAFPLGADAPQQLAALGPGVPLLSAPAAGTLVPLSDGRRVLVIASRDTLYAAEVSQQLSMDAGVNGSLLPPAQLAQRLVPAPGVPIRDVALGELSTPTSGTRGVGSFYVLARDSVFGVSILDEDLESWQATPIPLPVEFGPPRELWTEGGRGRVAYKSGHISALPTPVQLAPALPDGEATDFARLCGDTIAVVGEGLRRYDSDAGWLQVPGVQLAADAGARLYESGPSTFLATNEGRVLELTPRRTDAGLPACP